MKVLQIHNEYRQAGGEDGVLAAEAKLLRDAGHEVVQWIEANPESAVSTGLSLAGAPWNPRRAREAKRKVEEISPDIVHVHNTWFSLSPAVISAAASAGASVVMTLHNYRLGCINAQLIRDGKPCELCIGAGPWSGVRYRCYRDSMAVSAVAAATVALNRRLGTWSRSVSRFFALTDFAKGRMVEAGLPAEKVMVKRNFVPDPGPRATPPSASNTVLFVGRLSPEKGVATALRAWAQHPPSGLEFEIVGDGPVKEELEAMGVAGVRFLGLRDHAEVKDRMRSARALVFPSEWYEGMPMTLVEAFSSGLPVLASDLGSMSEMIAPIDEGWLVRAGDAERTWSRGTSSASSSSGCSSECCLGQASPTCSRCGAGTSRRGASRRSC